MYDEALTTRLRAALADQPNVSERKMMGGICFMVNGHMVGGAHREKTGEGKFMFRVGKANEDEALSRPGASPMALTGRRMGGLIFVDEAFCDATSIKGFLSLALGYVETLPPK